VQNLFCKSLLECKIYFARVYWSAKFILQKRNFILRPFGVQNLFAEAKFYFAALWSAKFILRPFGVQNLFCRSEIGVQNNMHSKAK